MNTSAFSYTASILAFAWMAIGCLDEHPLPPVPPSSPQLDIPWPSLAQTGWPMVQGNPQATGRSMYKGPSLGVVAWVAPLPYSFGRGVAIADSYIVAGGFKGLFAYGWDGSVLFQFNSALNLENAPLVGQDRAVYAASPLTCFNSSGAKVWDLPGTIFQGTGLTLGTDGTLFALGWYDIGYVYAVRPDGTVKWHNEDQRYSMGTSLTMSPDGSTLYVSGTQGPALFAVDSETGAIRWTFGNTNVYLGIQQSPMVDCAGNIYLMMEEGEPNEGGPTIYSLRPDGSIRWRYMHGNRFGHIWGADPCMDYNGNIYFALDTLYALDYWGSLRWKKSLNGWADAPLVCDVDGFVYVARWPNSDYTEEVICFTPEGDIRWRVTLPVKEWIDCSPALTKDGMLVLTPTKGRSLVAIR